MFRKPDTMGHFQGPLDCENQTLIHSQCLEQAGVLWCVCVCVCVVQLWWYVICLANAFIWVLQQCACVPMCDCVYCGVCMCVC